MSGRDREDALIGHGDGTIPLDAGEIIYKLGFLDGERNGISKVLKFIDLALGEDELMKIAVLGKVAALADLTTG